MIAKEVYKGQYNDRPLLVIVESIQIGQYWITDKFLKKQFNKQGSIRIR